MTERQWLDNADVSPMLAWLNERDASARKFRLFACAAARSLWDVMMRELARETVLIAERFADGELDEAQRRAGAKALRATYPMRMTPDNPVPASYLAGMVAYYCVWSNSVMPGPGLHLNIHGAESVAGWTRFTHVLLETGLWDQPASHPRDMAEAEHQCGLLRDIFGNPFHLAEVESDWKTETVTDLARAIYKGRTFDDLPLLADALQDAGCEDDQILAHCGDSGPHVRGCWVIDSLLGKM